MQSWPSWITDRHKQKRHYFVSMFPMINRVAYFQMVRWFQRKRKCEKTINGLQIWWWTQVKWPKNEILHLGWSVTMSKEEISTFKILIQIYYCTENEKNITESILKAMHKNFQHCIDKEYRYTYKVQGKILHKNYIKWFESSLPKLYYHLIDMQIVLTMM